MDDDAPADGESLRSISAHAAAQALEEPGRAGEMGGCELFTSTTVTTAPAR